MNRREFGKSFGAITGVMTFANGFPVSEAATQPSKVQFFRLGQRAIDEAQDLNYIYVRNLSTGMYEWAGLDEEPIKIKMK